VTDLARLLTIAEQAVTIGRDLIRTATPGQVHAKGDRDTVTDLDIRIERETRAFLAEQTPEIGFLGEEEGHTGPVGPGDAWTLDPIDGTANFVHGLPLCAVSLALVHDGIPVVAVIDLPFFGWRYTAAAGHGARRDGQPIHASATGRLDQAVVSIGDYAVGEEAEQKNARRLALTSELATRVERVRMFGSAAIDLCWVAEGRTDAAIILANKPWDIAAGALIAREAGAHLTDSTGDDHNFESNETLAMPGALREPLLDLLYQADDYVKRSRSTS
jgi:myo-inositol-1(or 4)-monophosphatase